MKISNKIVMALCLMLFFISEVSAVVYRTGFQQFKYGCNSNKEADLTMTAAAITDASMLDVTETTLMASINGTGNILNPVSGKTWKWGDYTTFGYEAEIYLEPGTYTFWGRYDDGGAVVMEDNVIYTHGNQSGYGFDPATGDFVVEKAGWYNFRGYVWDWSGGKAPCGSAKSAIQMKKDGGDWIIDMAGIPARHSTGEEYVAITEVGVTNQKNAFEVYASVTLPEGVNAQVYALASSGNIGYAPKANWSVATAAQEVIGTGEPQNLVFTVDCNGLEDPYIVIYSENIDTTGLSEAYASDSEWNTTYGYSSLFSIEESGLNPIIIENVSMLHNSNGAYTVSGSLYGVTADIYFIANDGSTSVTNIIQAGVEEGNSFSGALAELPSDKTYAISLYVDADIFDLEKPLGIIYTGDLKFSNPVNPEEIGLKPGSITVSRVNADPYPITFSYTITSTEASAAEGVTWAAPLASVTIPAGSTSVDIPVVPLLDTNISKDISLFISINEGNFEVPVPYELILNNKDKLISAFYSLKRVYTPSAAIKEMIGENEYKDFPVLVRLPKEVSNMLTSSNGTDIFILDEKGKELSFDLDIFNPNGETLVWVKVPSFSATTELEVFYSGIDNYENNSANVWTSYAGVWHFSPADVGATEILDATGNGLVGAITGEVSVYDGEDSVAGMGALYTTNKIKVPDYDVYLDDLSKFSVSGWFKLPLQSNGYATFFYKKNGGNWSDRNGWYIEMSQSKTKANLVLDNTSTLYFNDVSQNWNYFNVVSDGTGVKVYINGSSSPATKRDNYVILASGKGAEISAQNCAVREYRVRNGVASPELTALEYATMADHEFFVYGEAITTDESALKLSVPSIVTNADGSFTASVEVIENSGDVGFVYLSNDLAITNIVAQVEGAGFVTEIPQNLVVNKTYMLCSYGKNSIGTETLVKGPIFYNGNISIEELSDSEEFGLVPGVFRVSREDTAFDLIVNIACSGTAIAGQTYESLPSTVIIPAGSTYVDVEVKPMLDFAVNSDTTVNVTLADGPYNVDASQSSVEMTVINAKAPEGSNTWVASTKGLASDPNNWSKGRVPLDGDAILFDHNFSNQDCVWDVDAVLASWTQKEGYTGTIEFQTTFDDTLPQVKVLGDVEVLNGVWTHSANNAEEVYRLAVDVGGDFTLAATAEIDVRLKGFARKQSYPNAGLGVHAGGTSKGDKVYGDLYEPINLGSGSENAGGGAVHLVVGGDAVLEGLITTQSQKENSDYCGAPGSIYIKANTISGEGEILANSNELRSSGGRISLVVTGDNKLAKDRSKLNAQGNVPNTRGGAGTILVKTTAEAYGILYIDNVVRGNYFINLYPSHNEVTLIPEGENWIVDGIVFANEGILAVQEGTTLTLPKGFASISGSSHKAGLLYNGGTIIAADADEATDTALIQGKWVFQANEQFVFPGNLIVKDEGAVGCVRLRQITNVVYGCDIKVDGDMTVEETGFMYADVTGHTHGGYDWSREYYGDAYAYGGQLAMSTNGVYGSILNPNMPGSYGGANDGNDQNLGGGLIKVTVEGTLALDGKATAIGGQSNTVRGTGGAINITAGNLTGAGSIAAHGFSVNTTRSSPTNNNNSDIKTPAGVRSHRNVKAASPGGRVAIRLTDKDATLSEHWSAANSILAYGGDFTNSTTKAIDELYSASAGTIYIQEGDEEEGAGTIYVYNNGLVDNPAYTPIPSVKYNDGEDLSKTSLYAGAAGKVRICQEELKLNILTVEETSVIDLFGSTLSVTRAKIGGKSLGAGVYEPSDFADNLVDTSEAGGGTIVVLGEGTLILLR